MLLIDTGTYLNYIPVNIFKQLMSLIDFKINLCQEI